MQDFHLQILLRRESYEIISFRLHYDGTIEQI